MIHQFSFSEDYRIKTKKRIRKNVEIGKNKCWFWKGRKNKDGYGRTKVLINNKSINVLVHRVNFYVYNNKLNENDLVLHKCNNPSCCNPKHLYAGDHRMNCRDKIEANRGNHPKGSNHKKSKLKEKDVSMIWYFYFCKMKIVDIANYFNVSHSCICNILNRRSWREYKCTFNHPIALLNNSSEA